jgi:hypothetical protein
LHRACGNTNNGEFERDGEVVKVNPSGPLLVGGEVAFPRESGIFCTECIFMLSNPDFALRIRRNEKLRPYEERFIMQLI